MNPVNGAGNAAGIQQIIALRQQIIDKSQLLQQLHAPQAGTQPAATSGPAGGFTDALKSALDKVSATQNKVMLARQEAGVAFEATLQVRNRLLSAYQDIMRMGV